MNWVTVGAIAACLTMFSFVPQIVKILKTKSAKDVSLITLLQLALGTILWTAYGLHLKDKIIITANIVTLTTIIILSTLYFSYRRRE